MSRSPVKPASPVLPNSQKNGRRRDPCHPGIPVRLMYPEFPMNHADLNWIANYIWGIADDVLRDLYVRGKYRDVILPMTVLRRLDVVLEDTKQAVLDMKASLDALGIVEQDPALRQASEQEFYNTSKFTLRDLRSRANRQQLTADFKDYLDGFSPTSRTFWTTSNSATRFRGCPGPMPWAR